MQMHIVSQGLMEILHGEIMAGGVGRRHMTGMQLACSYGMIMHGECHYSHNNNTYEALQMGSVEIRGFGAGPVS